MKDKMDDLVMIGMLTGIIPSAVCIALIGIISMALEMIW